MSAHTPGPWFWSQGVDNWELVGADANRVLFCWNDGTKWKSGLIIGQNIKEADASLIAATPDMYEALECLTLVVGLTAFKHEGQRAALQEAMDQACAALAKARGQ